MLQKVVVLLSVAFNLATANSRAFEVHGHRGARARFPENTLPAFEHALKAGVDALEMDVNVTKDRVLVVHHDRKISPDTCLTYSGERINPAPVIYDLTLAQLKKFDCGSLKNPDFRNQQTVPNTEIPTLEEVLNWLDKSSIPMAKRVKLNIETKISPEEPDSSPTPAIFAKLLIDLLKKKKYIDRVVLQSFDYRTLVEARKIYPKIKISALTDSSSEDLVKTASELKADFISPRWTLVQYRTVEKLHALGVKVLPWTVNDRLAWAQLNVMGVDGIITDDPEALIAFLAPPK
ncbi:MAG: glycerophosphodiester phosphodiesterase family protein [Bdellovibrionia bacterium]